jgi:apolipoprotein N-acyltransferase
MKQIPNLWYLLVSGLLLALSFPPFDLVFPPFIALIPIFIFVRRTDGNRRLALGGLLMGVFFWTSLLYWVTIFSAVGFIALVLYLSAYTIIFFLGLRLFWIRGHLPIWLIAPPLWVVLEHLRAVGELAFTWGQLSYALTYHPVLFQGDDLSGPYGLSYWIVLVNALIYAVIVREGRRRALAMLALTTVIFLPLDYGYYCLGRKDLNSGEEITISLIQPNIDQDRKWSPAFRDSTSQILEGLSLTALHSRPDLIVWPETAVPAYIRHNAVYRDRVAGLAKASSVPFLVGAQDYERVGEKRYLVYNSAFLFHADGGMDDRVYNKIRLVPFGEKIPFEDRFPILKDIDYEGGHFTAGDDFTIFDIDGKRFGVLICFESTFPELSREFCRRGAGFLLNITNDAWFLKTSAPYQHASALPLRAVENRIYIGRAANTGITMIVDPFGRVVKSTPIFTRMLISGKIRARSSDTFYRRHGDWPAVLSWLFLLGALCYVVIMESANSTME